MSAAFARPRPGSLAPCRRAGVGSHARGRRRAERHNRGQGRDRGRLRLLLPIFAIVPVLFLVQEMTARLALATGKGHAELVRARLRRRNGPPSPSWAWQSSTSSPTWRSSPESPWVPRSSASPGRSPSPELLAIHASMVLTGSYTWFERFALALSLALFSFVVLAVAGRPDIGHLVSDLSPLPNDVPHDYFALVVAVVGASIIALDAVSTAVRQRRQKAESRGSPRIEDRDVGRSIS